MKPKDLSKLIHREPRTEGIVSALRGIHARAYTATPGSVSVLSGGGQSVTLEFLGAGHILISKDDKKKDLGDIVVAVLRKAGVNVTVGKAGDC